MVLTEERNASIIYFKRVEIEALGSRVSVIPKTAKEAKVVVLR